MRRRSPGRSWPDGERARSARSAPAGRVAHPAPPAHPVQRTAARPGSWTPHHQRGRPSAEPRVCVRRARAVAAGARLRHQPLPGQGSRVKDLAFHGDRADRFPPLLMAHADYFGLGAPGAALAALAEVVTAVSDWRRTAVAPDIGLTREDLDDFAPAFEHEALEDARRALQQPMRPRRAAMQMHRTEDHACPSNGTTLSHGAGRATGSFAGTQWLACGHGWAHRPAAVAPRRGRGPACDHHRSHKRTGGGW